MKRICVRFSPEDLVVVDRMVSIGLYKSRSECIGRIVGRFLYSKFNSL